MTKKQSETLTDSQQERWKELADIPSSELSDKEATAKAKMSLRRRYGGGAYTLVFEFAGPNGRRADAFAVSKTKGNNYEIIAFEIKASRSDWLSEKKDPRKQEHFVEIADEFYVVAARKGIVKEKELPQGWGLLELKPNSERLYKIVESQLTENQSGEPSRRFWAKLLGKVDKNGGRDGYTEADLAEAKSRGYDEAKNNQHLADRSKRELERMESKAEYFDEIKSSDIPITGYLSADKDIERLEIAYDIVKRMENNGYGGILNALERMNDTVESRATDALNSINAMQEQVEQLRDNNILE